MKLKWRLRLSIIFIILVYIVLFHNLIYPIFNETTNTKFTNNNNNNNKEPCALLFFGLPRLFKKHILSSIVENVTSINPNCDVFLHTYNITTYTNSNRMNREFNVKLNISEVFELTDHVVMDTLVNFEKLAELKGYTPSRFHKYQKLKAMGPCCTATDNMIKQWHSISRVWELMEDYANKNNNNYYRRVGLFRNDVQYPYPIDISNSDAAIPNFGNHRGGRNDRMFYGLYKYAKIWATKRFEFANIFIDRYLSDKLPSSTSTSTSTVTATIGRTRSNTSGLQWHSETMLAKLLSYYKVPYEMRNDLCVWRVRGTGAVLRDDCEKARIDLNCQKLLRRFFIPRSLDNYLCL